MTSYDFFIPTKVHFGAGRAGELGSIVGSAASGRRAALMCSANEWMAPIVRVLARSLNDAGIEVTARISGLKPNPTESECLAALETYREGGADVLVVAGGGSYLDAGKWLARESG
ncbi:MAG: iron-containing alcohol dehydrogenase, partial [Spirochaetia bacterium]